MRRCVKKVLLIVLSAACFLGFFLHQRELIKNAHPEKKEELVEYLRAHWQTPEDYIIGKFSDHDLVFAGEAHHIKHDLALIHKLIPLLYQNGVYNLGIEFGCHEYQDKVDSLITAESYDEDLARWILFKWASFWPYQEYMDIYKKAWELNKSLSENDPKFRVINLDYRARWDLVTKDMPARRLEKVFHKGERDVYMAHVIFEEIVEKGQKALIFAGQEHAATRFHHAVYDFKKQKFIRLIKNILRKFLNLNYLTDYPYKLLIILILLKM